MDNWVSKYPLAKRSYDGMEKESITHYLIRIIRMKTPSILAKVLSVKI
jgi:hypothetical protein